MALADERMRMGKESQGHRLRDDLRADALVGKDFQQNGMGHAAIDDMRFPDTIG